MQKQLKATKKKVRFTPITVFLLVVLCLWCCSLIFLMSWSVITSFKVNRFVYELDPLGFFIDYNRYLNSWSSDPNVEPDVFYRFELLKAQAEGWLPFYTYRHIFMDFVVTTDPMKGHPPREVGILEMYGNSALYSVGCAFTGTLVPYITAYACARYKYKFSRFIHTLVLFVMMVPIVGSTPSQMSIANALGLLNNHVGLWIMSGNFLGLHFLVFYDICKSFPESYSEAAKIDGATNMQVFIHVATPLLINTFWTVFLLKWVGFWNTYQTAQLFLPSYPVLAMGLNRIMNSNADSLRFDHTATPARMEAIAMTAIPVCIVFAIFQKRLLGNLTVGGIKG